MFCLRKEWVGELERQDDPKWSNNQQLLTFLQQFCGIS
jgi:hypothetical protein